MKKFLANTLVKWFKSLPFAGRFRFWCLYWAYRITGWHIRSQEWDFVLDYLPPLGKWQKVNVLDIGCARNLFCFEVAGRGYELTGIDLEEPTVGFPGDFYKMDITKKQISDFDFHFVTCISVLEHIEGNQTKSSGEVVSNKSVALHGMTRSLKVGGRLLITIPTKEFAQGHPWEGFSLSSFASLVPVDLRLIEYTERAGQLCLAIERIS